LKRVDLRQFLSDLIGQLIVDDHDRQGALRTELEVDELIIDPDKLAPIACSRWRRSATRASMPWRSGKELCA